MTGIARGLVMLACTGACLALAIQSSTASLPPQDLATSPAPGGNAGGPPAQEAAVHVTNGVVAYAEESIDEVLAREALHPTPAGDQTLLPGHLPSYLAEKPQPAAEGAPAQPAPRLMPSEFPGPAFEGPDLCNCEPPDPILTVGPSQVLMGINDQIAAADKSSTLTVWSVNWEAFFSSAKPSGGVSTSDPKVMFDPGTQRFFATILYINSGQTKSWWMLAVSTSSDISSSTVWRKWAIDPTVAAPGLFADYPGFGFDNNAVYITSNMFGGAGVRVDMAVIPKAQLLVSTPSPTFTQLTGITTASGSAAFTIQPTLTYGSGDCFFVSTTGSSGSAVHFYRINDPLGTPSLTKQSQSVTSYSVPPNAPQLGGGTVDTLDSRMLNAVWRGDRLWCTHPTAASGRAAARWYEFDTSGWPGSVPTTLQSGTVTDASASYYMPSIAVDLFSNAAMGFSRSSSTEFAAAWHTSRAVTDPPGTMGTPTRDQAGRGNYSGSRWGDFSGTVIDTSDGVTFWTIQEFANPASGGNNWDTWVTSFARVLPDLTPPTPDPMTFEIAPHASSTTAIAMRGTLATDADSPPVQYFFEFVSGAAGGHSSAWQSSQDYTNSGLAVNTFYSYGVTARDSAPTPNETQPSDTFGAYTLAEVPGAPVLSSATTSTLNLAVAPGGNPALTEFALQCAATPDVTWNGKYVDAVGHPSAAAVWQTNAAWGTVALNGLAAGTQYCFQAKARNGDLIETAFSAPSCASTASAGLRGDLNCDGSVNFKDINPFVLYLSNFSGWQATFPGCDPRNGDINNDGTYPSFRDINPFVTLLSGG